MRENDTAVLLQSVAGQNLKDWTSVILPAGTTVTIVLVHGDPAAPAAYEVEAWLADHNADVLATVETSELRGCRETPTG